MKAVIREVFFREHLREEVFGCEAGHFYEFAEDRGFYTFEEIPRELFGIKSTWIYFTQVQNGGHAQYLENTAWNVYINNAVLETINKINIPKAHHIFKEICNYTDSNPERRRKILRNIRDFYNLDDGKIGKFFTEKDFEFYSIGDEIYVSLSSYMNSLPYVRYVPEDEWNERLRNLVSSNPARVRRAACLFECHNLQNNLYKNEKLIFEKSSIEINLCSMARGEIKIKERNIFGYCYSTYTGDMIFYAEDGGYGMVYRYPEGDEMFRFPLQSPD